MRVKLGRKCWLNNNVVLELATYFPDGPDNSRVVIGSRTQVDTGTFIRAYNAPVVLGSNTFIGSFCQIAAFGVGIRIGSNVQIAGHCALVDTQHRFSDTENLINQQGFTSKGIIIEDDVWLGSGVSVMDGVTIGRGAVIGAGAVVCKNVPPYSVSVGVPSRVISMRK